MCYVVEGMEEKHHQGETVTCPLCMLEWPQAQPTPTSPGTVTVTRYAVHVAVRCHVIYRLFHVEILLVSLL